jgi:inner membrane protein
MQQEAIEFGREYARVHHIEQARVTAMPRPVSPFNWTVIVQRDSVYRYAHVNLVRKTARPEPDGNTGFFARLDAPYRPLNDAIWNEAALYGRNPAEMRVASDAYAQNGFRFFRWFAAYPALLRIDDRGGQRCAWFQDLRFITPGRAGTPFRYGMCREGDGVWRPFQLVGEERKAVY